MSEGTKSLRDIVAFQTADGPRSAGMKDKFSFLSSGPSSGAKKKLFIGLALAAVSAGGAAFLANMWFTNHYDRLRALAEQTQPAELVEVKVETRGVVVASRSVAYGEPLTEADLMVIEWPAENVPIGTFESIHDIVSSSGSRFSLSRLTENEPILQAKISEPGQIASLAAALAPGMKAVTIRVDDVLGVAGLVHPTDRVDVIWTRTSGNGSRADEAYSELLLPGIQVLAIDQRVDEGSEEGSDAGIARAITLEVDVVDAQKIALAAATGKLSLALRHVGADIAETQRRVTMIELGIRQRSQYESAVPQETQVALEPGTDAFRARVLQASSSQTQTETNEPAAQAPAQAYVRDQYRVVSVRRGLERSEYNVLSDPR